ncbi:DegV family protein [Lapidilactobacillus achengensis]|uniref:DegV family protein n=1 Tax=Lapidilactobacillus achengensis TaxID=2486000 RepID=A0ABW1UNM5_9LACO|nr:DegV family protein [Lapidilactobacillus achengensis]
MKTAILTDSASYLTPMEAAAMNVKMLPITVIFGEEQYLENVSITAPDFYQRLHQETKLPTTAQITMHQMQTAFDELTAAGYDEVICINLSSGITTFFENLSRYAQTVTTIKVYPFDSLIASAGEADLVRYAQSLVDQGEHASTIMPKLTALRATLGVDFAVDNLKHLLRTGRVSNASAFLGGLLQVKPILQFDQAGKIVAVAKERTMRRALQHALQDLTAAQTAADYPLQVTVIDGNAPETSTQWQAQVAQAFPQMRVLTSHIGPTIGVHTGEGVMGLLWSRDWRTEAASLGQEAEA